ncbi:hypothetical protein CYMTET_14140, partial [Cymbomonas tetramitiformis]
WVRGGWEYNTTSEEEEEEEEEEAIVGGDGPEQALEKVEVPIVDHPFSKWNVVIECEGKFGPTTTEILAACIGDGRDNLEALLSICPKVL